MGPFPQIAIYGSLTSPDITWNKFDMEFSLNKKEKETRNKKRKKKKKTETAPVNISAWETCLT